MDLLNGVCVAESGTFLPMAKRPQTPTSIDAISDRLRLLRLALGLKQAPFCRLVDISTTQWNNYERKRERISLDAALKVCAALGVSLDFIYRGERGALPVKLALDLQKAERESA